MVTQTNKTAYCGEVAATRRKTGVRPTEKLSEVQRAAMITEYENNVRHNPGETGGGARFGTARVTAPTGGRLIEGRPSPVTGDTDRHLHHSMSLMEKLARAVHERNQP